MRELIEESVGSDDTLRVTFVPGTVMPKTLTAVTATTSKSITYSLTPSGLARAITENKITDERLSLGQVLSRPGTTEEGIDLQYVFGGESEVARVALKKGTKGFLVLRYATDNDDDWAVGDVVDIIPVTCGRQRKDPPTKNGVWTITQSCYVTGVPEEDFVLLAA